MSWTISISATPRDQWEAAVDAAEAFGQDPSLPGVAEDVAEAKDALKRLGARVKRPHIAGQAAGHALQEDEGPNWSDSISASAYGVEELPPR